MKKLKKAKHFINSAYNEKKSLQALRNFDNITECIAEVFSKLKNEDFTQEELQTFANLEKYRERLLLSDEVISYDFFGSDHKDTVRQICKKAASPKIWCQFLHLLIKRIQAKYILEIGTNLGISGQYYLSGMPNHVEHQFITLEGIPRLCEISKERFMELGLSTQNEVIQGDFKETVPQVIKNHRSFDFVFIDGNHQYEPTVSYFNQLKSTYTNNAVLVFDDIYWTSDMEKAWHQIKNDTNVSCAIDFFKAGLLIFNPNSQKEKLNINLFLSRD